MALGISFIPGQEPDPQQQQPAAPTGPPLQQALQLLSLRLPRFSGSNAILPDPLLQGRSPGTPLPGTPEWQALMRRLLGGMAPSGAPPTAPPTNQTTPDWTYRQPPTPLPNAMRTPGTAAPPFPTIGQYPGAVPTRRIEPYPD
jgi:hypothetical protein